MEYMGEKNWMIREIRVGIRVGGHGIYGERGWSTGRAGMEYLGEEGWSTWERVRVPVRGLEYL